MGCHHHRPDRRQRTGYRAHLLAEFRSPPRLESPTDETCHRLGVRDRPDLRAGGARDRSREAPPVVLPVAADCGRTGARDLLQQPKDTAGRAQPAGQYPPGSPGRDGDADDALLSLTMTATSVVILGAGGRDFHNFNVYFRDRPEYRVVAFTAAQIPDIAGRTYPAELAGPLYPHGIPIVTEGALDDLIHKERVDQVVFAYSDISHEQVMHLASVALAAGAGFRLLGPSETMLRARIPVVAVCAVRTGSGKSQTARRIATVLRDAGRRVAVIRHPMAYGDLARQAVQRFATIED